MSLYQICFVVQEVHGLCTGFQVEFLVMYIFILHEVLSYIDSTAEARSEFCVLNF